jgi:hypothetical protein
LSSISVNMRATPVLAQTMTSLQLGLPSRISPIHLPLPYPKGSLDQFAEGFSIEVDSVKWTTDLSCTPYSPWQVGIWDTSRYDSASSTLATGVGAVAVGSTSTLSVATTNAGDLWSTSSGDRPFDIIIDQEQMTVTNLTSASSPQSFTVTRGVNGFTVAHLAGAQVHVFLSAVVAL